MLERGFRPDGGALFGSVAAPTAVGTATSDFSISDIDGASSDVRGCIDGAAADASVAGDCEAFALDANPPAAVVGSQSLVNGAVSRFATTRERW